MLSAIGDKAQKSAAAVFVLAVFVQMHRKFFNSACQKGYLDLWRPRVSIVSACFDDLIRLLSLCKHREMISHSMASCKRKTPLGAGRLEGFQGSSCQEGVYGVGVVAAPPAGVSVTFTSSTSKMSVEFAGIITLPDGSLTSSVP